ncbi:head-tail adaptor protein [Lampropedia aestuarii]|uniref:Head-tail adaptor protein n=1 Tax=Lampropedia aestuarii TaxID=2562762 RepID=A0A4S5BF59_9BURK|nr:phage head closure protein [Lampropedia aestuarii]THJ30944.1 head-tail adaptor protein [Lampropedia aestuarii]
MEAGKLNRRITIQTRRQGHDAAGQPLDGWGNDLKLWAWVKAPTGSGMANAQEGVARSITSYSIRVRYRPSLDNSMRVLLKGVAYDVRLVSHDHAGREWTDLLCEVGGNDG